METKTILGLLLGIVVLTGAVIFLIKKKPIRWLSRPEEEQLFKKFISSF